jgi:hypothetical protein
MSRTRKAQIQGANNVTIAVITSAGTCHSSALYTFDRLESGTIAGWHTKGNFVLDLVSKADEESLDDIFDDYLLEMAVNEVEQIWIDGQKDTYKTAADDDAVFGFISYAGEVNVKRRVDYGCGVFSGDTGNRASQANTMGGTTIQITSVETLATLTFPSGLLSTALVSVTAALTLAAGSKSSYTYLSVA